MPRITDIRDWTIYKITSPSGRVYIGKTVNFTARMRQYRHENHNSAQPQVHRSIKKYGYEAHQFEVIDTFSGDSDYAAGKEIFWIRSYMSNLSKYPEQRGLNLTEGGEGTLGVKKSDEERAAMSKRNKNKKPSDYQRQRASEVHKGNKWNLGRKQSPETIAKNLEARKWYKDPPDVVAKKTKRLMDMNAKPIIVINTETGDVVEYQCLKYAADATGMNRNTISFHLRGMVKSNPYKKNRKYIFKYKNAA